MDRFHEAVILFDTDGRVRYANEAGQEVLGGLERRGRLDTRTLLPKLGRMGGRIERIERGELMLGHAVYLAVENGHRTLAERERSAIEDTLQSTGWRLTETARRLGISRTTLWRRIRDYGLEKNAGPEAR